MDRNAGVTLPASPLQKKKDHFLYKKSQKEKSKKEKRGLQGVHLLSETAQNIFFKTWYKRSCNKGGHEKSDFELKEEKEQAKTKKKLWTLKVALRPSGVLLVFSESFGSSTHGNLCEESGDADFVRDAGECVSDCGVAECVLVRVFDVTSSLDLVADSVSVSVPITSQTLPFSEKRSAGGTLVCNETKKARVNVEEPKTMPKRTPFKVVFEDVRSRAPRFGRCATTRKAGVPWSTIAPPLLSAW